ncbi:MAG: class I SAM-dependent methyltransferase [Opitutaceae bacterium]|nr:class I SAM-dependent methyltransferase [Opitutaceae bacterium]
MYRNLDYREFLERGSWPVHFRSQLPHPCPICEFTTEPAGETAGRRTGRTFQLQRCIVCGFVFVIDPCTDQAGAIDAVGLGGKRADAGAASECERDDSGRCIQFYEWRGVERVARHFLPSGGKWLDYSCGEGGMVRFARAAGRFDVRGFEAGPCGEKARANGLPILTEDELESHQGTFDFATSLDVLEHREDPVAELSKIHSMLKPGGVLFFLTSNTAGAPASISKWPRIDPEIHASYFNHVSMKVALERGRFMLKYISWLPGFSDIVRYKTLRCLGVRRRNIFEQAVPWRLVSRLFAARQHLVDYSVGIAR